MRWMRIRLGERCSSRSSRRRRSPAGSRRPHRPSAASPCSPRRRSPTSSRRSTRRRSTPSPARTRSPAQITLGAPADVFASANTSIPATLYAKGVIEKPVNFTRNTLVIVVPKANPAGITSIYDLTKPGVSIDIAASGVPVGSYTLQILGQMNLTKTVLANVVSQETDVREVLAKVALGQVDAGFVYSTDAQTVPGPGDRDQGARLGAAEGHLRDGRRHEEPQPGGGPGVRQGGPEQGRPGQASLVRLPAADEAEGEGRHQAARSE